jgi:ribonuclease-3
MWDNFEEVQKCLGYKFNNLNFLKTALTHRSYSSQCGLKYCNERMEFLGDSVLSAVVSRYLYDKYPKENEGKLSQIKAQMVSAKNLSVWAKKIKLNKFIFISKSEEANLARQRESLLCDSFEAVIGAIYIDSDFFKVSEFINRFLKEQKEVKLTDYKTFLQEIIQAEFQVLPQYEVVSESGPDHDKRFEVAVFVKGKKLGFGKGGSKKEAEQNSAKQAYNKLNK